MKGPSTKGYGAARTGAGFSGTTSSHGGKAEAKTKAPGKHHVTKQAAQHAHRRDASRAALVSGPVAGAPADPIMAPANPPMPAGAALFGPETAPQPAVADMTGGAPNLGVG